MPEDASPDSVEACAEQVWLDGIYRTTCGYQIVRGKCIRHGEVPPDKRRPWSTPAPGA